MKHIRTAAFAALGVAAALSLTACGGDDSGNDASGKGGSSSSSQSSDSSKGGSSDEKGGSENGDKKSDAGDTEARAAKNGAGQDADDFKPCKTQDLAIDAVDAAPDAESGRIDITMVNRGNATCSVTGFAGVGITDADHTTNPIGHGKAEPRLTNLQAGDAAVFNLAYDIDSSGKSLAHPTGIQVTPPKQSTHVNVKWPSGAGEIKGAYTDVEVYPTHTTK